MSGKQDDQAGPTVRHIRSAMTALDKIVALDISHTERARAIGRILRHGRRLMDDEDVTAAMAYEDVQDAEREVAGE